MATQATVLPQGPSLAESGASVAAVVLAGGASRRMGTDKATLEIAGRSLAERVVTVASTVAATVMLVAPQGHPVFALISEGAPLLGLVQTVHDAGMGPVAAIAAGLAVAQAPWAVVLAADHPDLRSELLVLLLAARGAAQGVVARRDGRLEPLVGVYRRAATLAAAQQCLQEGQHALHHLLARLDITVVEEPAWRLVDPRGASFEDVDTPQELWARRRSEVTLADKGASTGDTGDRTRTLGGSARGKSEE